MRLEFSERFRRSYEGSAPDVRKAVDKQLGLLLQNLRHPSLHAKKYDEARDIWQARVTRSWRLYFTIEGETYQIIDVIPHPK